MNSERLEDLYAKLQGGGKVRCGVLTLPGGWKFEVHCEGRDGPSSPLGCWAEAAVPGSDPARSDKLWATNAIGTGPVEHWLLTALKAYPDLPSFG